MANQQPDRRSYPTDRPRKRRRKRKGASPVFRIICIVVVLFIAFMVFRTVFNYARRGMSAGPSDPAALGEAVTVVIPEGSTTKDIAEILKENELIDSVFLFRLESKSEGYDGTYHHGTYSIQQGLEPIAIMELLKAGSNAGEVKITIPEGFTVKKIAELVEQSGLATAEEFIAAANSRDYDFDFIADIPDRPMLLEGYLFPETYFFPAADTTAQDIVNRLLTQFNTVISTYTDEISASAYTLDQLVTIASLVESEIQVPEERPVAAGVIYNRLNADMPLQIDATVLYAQGVVKEDVTYDDLEVESDYNTYQNKGLPIGPISNPGKDALAAALAPAEHNYLYYVLKARGSGEHVYTETYEEFLEAKEAYKNS